MQKTDLRTFFLWKLYALLLDHLIGTNENRLRDSKAEGIGSLAVDDQFKLCRLLDWEIGGFRPFENAVHIIRGTTKYLWQAGAVTHEPACIDEAARSEYRR